MDKKLTDNGIEPEENDKSDEVEEIEVDLPPRENKKEVVATQNNQNPTTKKEEPKQIQPKEKKQAIKDFNENPTTKKYGAVAMKKTTYIALWVFAGLFFVFLIINMIWGNTLFANKDFAPIVNLNNENNIQPPDITNNYETNNTIINNINLGGTMAEIIAERVLEIINNQTNSS